MEETQAQRTAITEVSPDSLVHPVDAAKELNLTPRTLSEYMSRKKISYIKYRGKRMLTRDDIDAFKRRAIKVLADTGA